MIRLSFAVLVMFSLLMLGVLAAHADKTDEVLVIIYPREAPDFPHYALATQARCKELQEMSRFEQLFVGENDGLPSQEIGRIECQCVSKDHDLQGASELAP